MSVRTNVTSVKAGQVTFDVTNLSRSIVHEMIVVAVENPNAPLPYDYNTGQIPEKQVKMLGGTDGHAAERREDNHARSHARRLPADLQCAGPLCRRHVDTADGYAIARATLAA